MNQNTSISHDNSDEIFINIEAAHHFLKLLSQSDENEKFSFQIFKDDKKA